jgi:hypothetical protein
VSASHYTNVTARIMSPKSAKLIDLSGEVENSESISMICMSYKLRIHKKLGPRRENEREQQRKEETGNPTHLVALEFIPNQLAKLRHGG